MEQGNDFLEQVNDVYAKYKIASIDDAKVISEEKGIDVSQILSTIKENLPDNTIKAFELGTAIAVKKDTKLSSYVAIDICEGLKAFCNKENDEELNKAFSEFGQFVCEGIKAEAENVSSEEDYGKEFGFLEMTTDELICAVIKLSKEVEEKMKD